MYIFRWYRLNAPTFEISMGKWFGLAQVVRLRRDHRLHVIPPLAGTGQLGHQGEQSVRFLWFGIGTKYWDGRIDRVPARGKSCTSLLYII